MFLSPRAYARSNLFNYAKTFPTSSPPFYAEIKRAYEPQANKDKEHIICGPRGRRGGQDGNEERCTYASTKDCERGILPHAKGILLQMV
jgi:hypothetical protein